MRISKNMFKTKGNLTVDLSLNLRSAFELIKLKTKEPEGNGIKDLKTALDKLQLAKKAAEEAEKKKKEEENRIDVIPDPELKVQEKPPPCFRFYEYLHDKKPEKKPEQTEPEKEKKEEDKEDKPVPESGNPEEPVKDENPVNPDNNQVDPGKPEKKKGKKLAKKLKIKINKKQLENLVTEKIGLDKGNKAQ